MKKTLIILISTTLFFAACHECIITEIDNPNAKDCPELLLNIGDSCDDGDETTSADIVTENCECIGTNIFDCPDLGLNIGDPCDDSNPDTTDDVINGNCECVGGNIEVDCPDLMLNIGDTCIDGDDTTINDIVTADCECIGESIFDCPDLSLNIGDSCDDENPDTQNDVVTDLCECIGEIIVDCPDLGLNIGDPCDDGNPDTANDVVDEMCICVGEVVNECMGRIIALKASVENNALGTLSLEIADKLAVDQVNFNISNSIPGSLYEEGEAFPIQFSTINPAQNRYHFGFQYNLNNTSNPLLITGTDGSISPSNFLSVLSYAAPVYHQGELYAIDVVYDNPIASYSILKFDLSDGQLSTILTGTISVNSQVVNPLFFSTSNGSDKIFFLAGTSLLEYDVNANTAEHTLLEPNQNPDIPVAYTGLEYQADVNQLLAIKSEFISGNVESALVSISQDGNYSQNALVNIEDYIFFSDGGILHSTAYSQCDNKYYIATPAGLEEENFESFLIEIDPNTTQISDNIFPEFLFGLEVQEW